MVLCCVITGETWSCKWSCSYGYRLCLNAFPSMLCGCPGNGKTRGLTWYQKSNTGLLLGQEWETGSQHHSKVALTTLAAGTASWMKILFIRRQSAAFLLWERLERAWQLQCCRGSRLLIVQFRPHGVCLHWGGNHCFCFWRTGCQECTEAIPFLEDSARLSG